MTLLVSVVELATLYAVVNLQKTESQDNALQDAKNISKSLHNDLLQVTLNSNIDLLSDISFRLSAFKKINGVILYDQNNQAIYKYGTIESISYIEDQIVKKDMIFTDHSLYIKQNLEVDNFIFGYTLIDIDLEQYNKKHDKLTNTILSIFPFALILGFIISIFISKNYTEPFSKLIEAFKTTKPTQFEVKKIETSAKNEIKDLFDGFNNAMKQIFISSQKLVFQAEHDQLTGLKNRFYIENHIQEILKDESKKQYAILSIDIDQFKLINDKAGLQAGDELLKMLTSDYEQTLPKNSIFARIDGDEFIVLLKDTSIEDATSILDKSLQKLSDFRFVWEGEAFGVSASIGMVFFKPFEYTLEELIKRTHYSIYTAKSKGRNKSYILQENDEISKRFDTETITATYIKEALKKGNSRFELFAQAIVPLQYETSKISYEILLRMWDKDNNFISPDDFLPTANRYQLMSEIDIYVLWSYLESVTKSPEHIKKLHSAHINLSGSSLNNQDFQNKLKLAVETFDFPWERLELEVTETSAVGNFNKANEFISWIKSVGIGLALDDFGTGMASFEYLKSLPFDVVKIDGSFVKDMHSDPIDKAVIKYIQEIATLKGQETIAEYVETQEDLDTLKSMGITYSQGYFTGRPKPLSQWL
ncbi:MAG: EAL domain-containing protein [Campylobacterota bacterium]|nr:EAL domain-containing protein [Campylobacterota bacterium]